MIHNEIDYDFEWNTLVEIAKLTDEQVLVYFEEISLDIGAGHLKEGQRKLRKIVRSEIFLRMSNQHKGVL